jgi:hypothetical protein
MLQWYQAAQPESEPHATAAAQRQSNEISTLGDGHPLPDRPNCKQKIRRLSGVPSPTSAASARSAAAGDHRAMSALSIQSCSLRMGGEKRRKPCGVTAGHAAFGGHTVDLFVATCCDKPSKIAGRIVVMNEAEIKLGLGWSLRPAKGAK